MSSQTWSRLIRFIDDNGNETFGEPLVKSETELEQLLSSQTLYATEFKGQSPTSELVKGEKVHVKAIRDILKPSDVPIIRCIGLNYIKHSKLFPKTLKAQKPYFLLTLCQSRRAAALLHLTLLFSSNPPLALQATLRISLSPRLHKMGLLIMRVS
jgi:2-keto-4-pentenoate hydratase/2-oxohepta-3-ene-1,7-dioic acid hydratase in catechol pathway